MLEKRPARFWAWRTVKNPEWPFGTGRKRIPHPLANRHGELAREICRGRNGNALIEFSDGFRTVAPWRALRPTVRRGGRSGFAALLGAETYAEPPAAALERPSAAHGWELRGRLASGRPVRLLLSDRCDAVLPNQEGARVIQGRVTKVAATDAFAIVADVHVPIDEIVELRTPHYSQAAPSKTVYDKEAKNGSK